MATQYINTGTAPNQGNGDSLRTAFTKVNANFKLYENLQAISTATTSSQGVVMVGSGLTIDPSTGALSGFSGNYNNLNNIPQSLGITDSPQFAEVSLGTELGATYPFTSVNVNYNVNDYTQAMFQNHMVGSTATSDLIIANDSGSQTENMIDLGINSTGYSETSFSLQTPGSGYLFTNGADLFIGTQTPGKKLVFHAGGTTTEDSGGTLDAYAWRFNRSVQVSVATAGPLNFTVQNTSNNSLATAMYQAIADDGNTIMVGVNSSARTDGLILPGEGFMHLDGTGKTMHIGNKSGINFYANAADGYTVNPMLALKQNGTDAILDGHFIPYEHSVYDLGSSTATWRSVYLSTGTIYMDGIPIEMNTATNQLVVAGEPVGANIRSVTSATVTSHYVSGVGGPYVGSVVAPCQSNGYLVFGGPVGNENQDLLAGIDLSKLSGATLVQGGVSTDTIFSVAPEGTPGWYVFAMSGGIANGDGYVGTTLTIIPDANRSWTFETNGSLKFPDSTIQTTAALVRHYGAFSDSTTQIAVANTATQMTFNTTDISNGISMVDGSKITISSTGTYNIQFSAQIDRIANGTDEVSIWLRKNGINVPLTNTDIIITGTSSSNPVVAAWNLIQPAAAGDYFELMWSTPNDNVHLQYKPARTNPDRPETPSVILTVVPA